MATPILERLKEEIENLSLDEVRELLEYLQRRIRMGLPRRRWSEIAGKAPYPLAGEDAQQWVSRTRQESTLTREQRLGDAQCE